MKGSTSILTVAAALAAGLGAGHALRGVEARPRASAALRDVPPPGPAENTDGQAASPVPESPATLPEWNPALTAEENALAIHAALERAPVERILEWLRVDYRIHATFSFRREDRAWQVTRDALLDRLLEKDPAAFAGWVSGMPAVQLLMRPWVEDAAEALRRAGTPEAAAAAERLKAAHPEPWREAELLLLSESDPGAALAMLSEYGHLTLPESCADLLAADPARALAFARERPSSLPALAAAFQRLGPEALESFAEKCPGDSETARAVWQLAAEDRARRGDGKEFAAFLLAHPGIQETSAHLLAEADPAAAEEAVRALADAPEVQERVLASLALTDPAMAARLFAASPDAAAILEAEGSQSFFHESLLTALTRSWTLRDPAALRAWARSLPPALQAGILPKVAESLGGAEFLEFTRGAAVPDGSTANLLGSQAVLRAGDTPTLLSWLAAFPEADRDRLAAGVCVPLAARDLQAATDLAAGVADLHLRERLTRTVGESAAFTDPRAAAAWGNALPRDLRVSGLSAALEEMATRAGAWAGPLTQAVAEVIAAEPPDSAAVWSGLARLVTENTADRNFAEGAAFVSGLPEAAREESVEELGLTLSMTINSADDPVSALAELERVPDPAVRRSVAGWLRDGFTFQKEPPPEQSAAFLRRLENLSR